MYSHDSEVNYFDFSYNWKEALRQFNDPPSISLSKFTFTGEVDIIFSDQFIRPAVVEDIRARQKLELDVLPYDDQTKEDVKFEWSVKSFAEDKMTIKLVFDRPFEIKRENIFTVIVTDNSLFIR